MKTSLFLYVTMIFIAALLAIGSFMGFPNDPQLGGVFWILVACFLIWGGVR